jgi:hypothetical protein
MSLKDEYFAMMVSRFKRWDAEFGMLGEKGGQSSGAADAQFDAQLKALRASRDAAYRKLQEIRTSGESSWRGMQAVVDAAWVSLRMALDQASSQAKLREKTGALE